MQVLQLRNQLRLKGGIITPRISCFMAPQHFTSQREDFEGTREGILVWLTEMDLQLTNVEHFSESDVEDKMRQLKVRRPAPAVTLNLQISTSTSLFCVVFAGLPTGDHTEHQQD